jgi:hypothetical protein
MWSPFTFTVPKRAPYSACLGVDVPLQSQTNSGFFALAMLIFRLLGPLIFTILHSGTTPLVLLNRG